ncbi:necrosis inducing protein [Xylariaceae sp. FL0804]|nr:necrosis inducing protein [Xylariaceae sp. FL0804]
MLKSSRGSIKTYNHAASKADSEHNSSVLYALAYRIPHLLKPQSHIYTFTTNKMHNTAILLLAAAASVSGSPVQEITKRDVLTPLPQNAYPDAIKFQPVMDFDTDSCYNTAAIDPDGNTNPGLQHKSTGVTENCRQLNRLENANVYSRMRCNNGVCAIMYEYYFEKDVVSDGNPTDLGHRHDWEDVVVFVQDDTVKMVAPSCHAKYEKRTDAPRLLDTHPKVVYHKDGGSTHCIRMANEDDDAVENETGDWVQSALVGWDGYPSQSIRDTLGGTFSDGIGPKWDSEFTDYLNKAQGDYFPEFDPSLDE